MLSKAGHGQFNADVQSPQLGVEFLHFGAVGRCVATPRERGIGGTEQMAHGGVGGHHEGLDHFRGLVGPLDLHAQRIVPVEARAKLGIVQVEADLSPLPHGRQFEHLVVGVCGQHVVVGDVVLDPNHRFVSLRFSDVVVVVQRHRHHHRQPVNAGPKGTQLVGQFGRQHRQDGVGQIHRSGSGGSRSVEGRARFHVMGDICDGHPQCAAPVFGDQTHGVVEILGIGRVDGHERKMPQIRPPCRHLAVPVHFRQAVGSLNQQGIVGGREGIAPFASSPFQASLQEFAKRKATGVEQQQRQRWLVVPEPKPRAPHGAFASFLEQVKALEDGTTAVVQGVSVGERRGREHGLPHRLEQMEPFHVVLTGVLEGQGRATKKRGFTFPAVSAEEVLPRLSVGFQFSQRICRSKANAFVFVLEEVRSSGSPFGERFVHRAQEGAFGFGVRGELGGQAFVLH